QQELLTLAERQGLLYAHQLPAANDGFKLEQGHRLFTQLLSGRVEQLESVRPSPVEVIDTELDEVQREAVAKALATTDVCLLQGLPGTGKSRVVAEIVLQAAQ